VLADEGAMGEFSEVGMGGIAGYNAVPDSLSGIGTVQNCVALNLSLTAPSGFDNVHRVIGKGGGTIQDNLASSGMTITISGSPSVDNDVGPNAKGGKNCDAKPSQSVYEGVGWDFVDVWKMGTDGYPVLQWQQL
jgi:hypothetical protein